MIYLDEETVRGLCPLATGFEAEVRDYGLLSSAVARPMSGFGGHDVYPDVWTKAVALGEGIARNHALLDGNKRTAFLAIITFLDVNGSRRQSLVEIQFGLLVVAVESHIPRQHRTARLLH